MTAFEKSGVCRLVAALMAAGFAGCTTRPIDPPPAPPSGLTYPENPAIYVVGTPITLNVPTWSGGAPDSFALLSPAALPPGLSLATNGTISGTPAAASAGADYTIQAANAGGTTTAVVHIEVDAEPAPLAHVTVSGTVSASSAGIANITMTATALEAASPSASAQTDSLGSYAFTSLRKGTYTLVPSSPGLTFTPVSTIVTVDAVDVSANFSITGATVSGSIKSGSTGVAGVTVTLAADGGTPAPATALTGSDGAFSFTDVPAGAYTVTPSSTGVTFTPTSGRVTVGGSNQTANFTVGAVAVSGTIQANAAGVAGVTVTLTASGSSTPTGTAQTDSSGAYAFSDVPLGTYTVAPAASGLTFTPASAPANVGGPGVAIDFTVATVTISGNAGVQSATVSLTPQGASTPIATAPTDSNGGYAFTNVPPGSYSIAPSASGLTFSPSSTLVNAVGIGSTANFTVSTVTLSGTVKSAGVGVPGVTISLAPGGATATTSSSGTYAFSVAPGTYAVTPSSPGVTFSPSSSPVTISNVNATGDFVLTGVTISGTIMGAGLSPSPVVGATVTLTVTGTGATTGTTTTNSSGQYAFAAVPAGSYTITPSGNRLIYVPTSKQVAVSTTSIAAQNFSAALLP
jgi:inhibitor of cysteine peptidase